MVIFNGWHEIKSAKLSPLISSQTTEELSFSGLKSGLIVSRAVSLSKNCVKTIRTSQQTSKKKKDASWFYV